MAPKFHARMLEKRRTSNLYGITHPPVPLRLWRRICCPRGWHLFDEVWSLRRKSTRPDNPIEGVKLLDGMTHDGSQYLQTNSRDFFAMTADPKPVVPTTTTTQPKKK